MQSQLLLVVFAVSLDWHPEILLYRLEDSFLSDLCYLLELVGEEAEIIDVDGLLSEVVDVETAFWDIAHVNVSLLRLLQVDTFSRESTCSSPSDQLARQDEEYVPGLVDLQISNALPFREDINEGRYKLTQSMEDLVGVLYISRLQPLLCSRHERFGKGLHRGR